MVTESFAGQLSSISPTGEKTTLVNAPGKEIVGVSYDRGVTYYFENAGSTGELYSHPFSSVPALNGVYVGDAGANTILHVNNHGKVSLVQALSAEPIPITEAVQDLAEKMGLSVPDCMLGHTYWAQPVPTDITVQGNWLYYTVLPGVPDESLSSGKVYKMNLHTKKI